MTDDFDHQAYMEYMLGGKVPATPSPLKSSTFKEKKQSSTKKKQGSVFRAFQGRLDEWKDLDGQLEQVVGSITNLRDRIVWEFCLEKQKDEEEKEWAGFGFRSSSCCLSKEDVELALTHDLLQHERMLSGARGLVSSLARVQDALGRRLDEWMVMELEDPEGGGERLGECQQVYSLLAQELYRKQELVQQLLDSCHDGMLAGNEEQVFRKGGSPQTIARRCVEQWSYREKQQSLLVDSVLRVDYID
jgi:hypothetical protein